MKVLFISSWYPTPQNPNLGVFVKEHARAIKTTEHDIRVLAVVVLRDEPYLRVEHREYIDEVGIRTVEITIKSRIRDVIYHLVPLQKIIAFHYYKKKISPYFTPDVIHSNVVFPAGMIGDYFSRKLKVPHVITEHWSKIQGILKIPYLGRLTRKVYQRASLIFPVSDFLRGKISCLIPDLSSDKFRIVPNVISPEVFDYRPKNDSNAIRFCAVATWATKRQPDKKPELFIEALAKVQHEIHRPVKLTMVGGGNRVNELKVLCRQFGVDADFVGYNTKHQIANILHQSDCFLHASLIETFGVVVVEALMTGTPVICSSVGALPELIDDKNGVLCQNTVEEWETALKKYLASKYDFLEISESVKNRFSYINVGRMITCFYNTGLSKI
ncbi:MAG: hypothetical protein RIS29_2357 [Bacteroidota bacterium]|jgi:glycosyltransferase involved in cell wall biosynthesis